MKLLGVLIVGLIAGQAQPNPLRAGVMLGWAEAPVAALEGPVLAAGAELTVVAAEHPQQAWQAVVTKHLAASDEMAAHGLRGPFYEIAAAPGSAPLPVFAVVIVGRPAVTRAGDAVVLGAASSSPGVRVRSCASTEGLHLTLWAGTPLKSRRLWHTYYYLGYGVEPTCTRADYEDPGQP